MSLWNGFVFILLPQQKIARIFILAACKGICQYFGEFIFGILRRWGLWQSCGVFDAWDRRTRRLFLLDWWSPDRGGPVGASIEYEFPSPTICKYSPTMPPLLCPVFLPPLQQQRDNIWWLFCHFSTFSPEFCLPDKAMIFNRGLIEPSHVLVCRDTISTSTAAALRVERVRASICLVLTKRKHIEKRRKIRVERLRKRKEAWVCAAAGSDLCDESSESVSWVVENWPPQLFARRVSAETVGQIQSWLR